MSIFPRVVTILLSFIMSLASLSAHSQNIIIDNDVSTLNLTQNIEYLVDEKGNLTLEDVLRKQDDFVAVTFPFGAGFSKNAHWFKFTLQREQGAEKDWLLAVNPIYLDSVKLYTDLGANGHYSEDEVGDQLPASSRISNSILTLFSFPIALTDTHPHTFYIRLQTESSTVLQLTLRTILTAELEKSSLTLKSGIEIGGWLMLCLYACVMSWLSKKNAYILSCLYVIGCMIRRIHISGIAAQYIFPNDPFLVSLLAPLGVCLMISGVTVFFMTFFKTKTHFKKLHFFLKFELGIVLVAFISIFLGKYYLIAPFMFYSVIILFPILSFIIWRGVTLDIAGSRSLFWGFLIFFLLNGSVAIITASNISTPPLLLEMPELASFVFILLMYQGLYQRKKIEDDRKRESKSKIELANKNTEMEKKLRVDQSNFMMLITHELKTPLTVIDSVLQTLDIEKINISAALAARHNLIKKSLDELNSLINTTLMTEHSESKSFSPIPKNVDVYQSLHNAINQLSIKEQESLLKVPRKLKIYADPSLFNLVLSNLLRNALKYKTPDSLIAISATKTIQENKNGTVISISNYYDSIEEPNTEIWFQKYYRQSDTPNIQGFGLGLYLTKAIIEAHSGQIKCHAEKKQNLWKITFEIWFPSLKNDQDLSKI
ncbi:sensor histidine kinase [Marinomonas rhizomae]|uniref:sensor histidine kinase n=1 Tax=Marinomonas rhizomae TaxID=491948 RepID=UPI002101F173|nr:sensor histidine kinase [Marinomonas rhizomae]UTV99989.1 sensor histidine kinase [Marinomonas rhizomae]